MIPRGFKKTVYSQNRCVAEASKLEQISVTGHYVVRPRLGRAFQHAVVRWIVLDDVYRLRGRNDLGDAPYDGVDLA